MMSSEAVAEIVLRGQAIRDGLDIRPGKRHTVRVESIAQLAEAGRVIELGESTLLGVHDSDIAVLRSLVEDYATLPRKVGEEFVPSRKFSLSEVEVRRVEMQAQQNEDGRKRMPASMSAAWFAVAGRSRKPLISMEIVTEKKS